MIVSIRKSIQALQLVSIPEELLRGALSTPPRSPVESSRVRQSPPESARVHQSLPESTRVQRSPADSGGLHWTKPDSPASAKSIC